MNNTPEIEQLEIILGKDLWCACVGGGGNIFREGEKVTLVKKSGSWYIKTVHHFYRIDDFSSVPIDLHWHQAEKDKALRDLVEEIKKDGASMEDWSLRELLPKLADSCLARALGGGK